MENAQITPKRDGALGWQGHVNGVMVSFQNDGNYAAYMVPQRGMFKGAVQCVDAGLAVRVRGYLITQPESLLSITRSRLKPCVRSFCDSCVRQDVRKGDYP